MLRSPMVMRNFFEATAGKRRTRLRASSMLGASSPSNVVGVAGRDLRTNDRRIFGGLPNKAASGRSIGDSSARRSVTSIRLSERASPTTAYGHRSRAQM